eukprot:gb/GFBE01020783.1/.p1 GENE.gb/GFBE01020783.1/~~gb/GFBE01020783.1/.p1  ORF type:complete len:439 (+),score=74.86 gb/GFBE01020783.1/:1-1317(+)
MLATPLCRCICGSRKDDLFDTSKALEESQCEFEDQPTLPRSHVRGVLLYDAAPDQPLRGVPIREEPLWLLSADEEVSSVTVSLYVNGLAFRHKGQEHSFSFSPFSLVRNCKFQATTSDGVDLSQFKCFKVSMFTQGACFYFGVREETEHDLDQAAEEKRACWVLDVSRAMRLVTQSLFPTFNIACYPVAEVPRTRGRLMAGYLAHHDDASTTSVLYCELHPQKDGQGRLVIYENESCEDLLREICITERTSCTDKVGISCSCFSVEEHMFSARTIAERKLWLRAISNVKVKVQNCAPEPQDEELQQYRAAILEHARSTGCNDGQAATDALLRRQVQKLEFPEMPFGYGQDGHFAFPPFPPDPMQAIQAASDGLDTTAASAAEHEGDVDEDSEDNREDLGDTQPKADPSQDESIQGYVQAEDSSGTTDVGLPHGTLLGL